MRLYKAKKPKNVFLDGISIGEEEAKTFENLTRIEISRKDIFVGRFYPMNYKQQALQEKFDGKVSSLHLDGIA